MFYLPLFTLPYKDIWELHSSLHNPNFFQSKAGCNWLFSEFLATVHPFVLVLFIAFWRGERRTSMHTEVYRNNVEIHGQFISITPELSWSFVSRTPQPLCYRGGSQCSCGTPLHDDARICFLFEWSRAAVVHQSTLTDSSDVTGMHCWWFKPKMKQLLIFHDNFVEKYKR